MGKWLRKCYNLKYVNNRNIIFLISKITTALDISSGFTAPALSTAAVEGYWYRPL